MSATHLLTGAGSGIGAALAERLHARGETLVLLARSGERAAELESRYPGSRVLAVDLADPEAVTALTGLPDELDSVLHVAGVVDLAPVAEQPLAQLRAQVDVNLVSPAVLTHLCLPAVRRRRGTFVFVNSSAGLSASADWSAYAASKFGLRALADSLRAEEVEHGVRVTTVFPSRTATPMQEKVHEQEGRTYDASRWISPATVAETILHVLDLPEDATIPEVTIRPVVARAN
ncbi:SDR family oxidoreductase [Nocardioides sp. cx-173]|uniref:SDR family oxidoreductase n=1 Tax=Nocardioides sp. cx-173 TaxID=2898796 RepID=UPI001E3B48E4|nr:SDR family oxidoreductase [Nocardioides sp. cx-173]MCD4526172.1 SDR family oxidoreductase [Nocardioides sp. cx-173]UGB40613.1 SDR family oxidoreductase [Nocardioides sp. cx-173]